MAGWSQHPVWAFGEKKIHAPAGNQTTDLSTQKQTISCSDVPSLYGGAEKSLARPRRKQATATEGFDFHISYL